MYLHISWAFKYSMNEVAVMFGTRLILTLYRFQSLALQSIQSCKTYCPASYTVALQVTYTGATVPLGSTQRDLVELQQSQRHTMNYTLDHGAFSHYF